ncbi:MAG: hypothetical protein KAR06_01010 [Deltaproteobacteria bacterium]|nr:hypothetical protein [Deltaproteobacteria bacterium]
MSRFEKILLKKGPAEKKPAKGQEIKSEAEHLSQKEIDNDLKKHLDENPTSAASRAMSRGAVTLEESLDDKLDFTDEEIENDLEKLKKNRPHLYDTLYESSRSDKKIKRALWITLLKNRIFNNLVFVLLSIPFILDVYNGTYTRSTDYTFALFGAGLVFFGPLRRTSIQFQSGVIIAIIWFNVNPFAASLIKVSGFKKYLVEVAAIGGCFFVVEILSSMISGGTKVDTSKQSTLIKWVRSSVALLCAVFVLSVFYAGADTTAENAENIFYKVRYFIDGIINR